ncbi:MAG: sulfotransferase [Pirellulales bacterium]|nr:sulfotransferase [Pirellulales bacterium]
MGTTIVVLGMHRSGTSCVTRMLNHCGMDLGSNVLDTASVSNMAGKWEARPAVEINDALLQASGGSWDNPPAQVQPDETAMAQMREFLGSLAPSPMSGWKDPRTVLTFPLWKSLLGSYRIVACLRHPRSVAESLAKREGWPLERGLELWLAYNERLLKILDQEQDVVWFDFDLSMSHIEPWLRNACGRLGLEFNQAAVESFNEFNRHHRHADTPEDTRIRAVYQDLWFRAHQDDIYQAMSAASRSGTAATERLPTVSATPVTSMPVVSSTELAAAHERIRALEQSTETLSMQLRYLADAHNSHHTLTQPIARGFDKLRARWEDMERWQKKTDDWSTVVEKRTGKLIASVKTMTQQIETIEGRLTGHDARDLQLEKMINKYGDRWSLHEGRLSQAEAWAKSFEQRVESDMSKRLAKQDHRLAACELWIAEYERKVAEYRARMADCEKLLNQCADRVSQCETVVSDLSRSRLRWMLSAAKARVRRLLNWLGMRRWSSADAAGRTSGQVPPPKGHGTGRPTSRPAAGQNLRVDRE